MTALTQKQEAFCLAYIETGNASEAYRRAYNAENMAPATTNRKAKEVLDNGKIAARITELRKPVVLNTQLSLEKHLNDLAALRNAAVKDKKWSAAVAAEVARGKAAGLYSEKVEVTGAGGGPIEGNMTTNLNKSAVREMVKQLRDEYIEQ